MTMTLSMGCTRALRPASTVLRQSPRVVAASGGARAYTPSSSRLALKESDRHNENVHHEIDHHKNDQLKKQKEGKGHWKDELASDSESAVKADRHEHPDGAAADMEALQEKAKKESESEKHKS